MFSKRGQLAAFLIIAIVLVISAVFVGYIVKVQSENTGIPGFASIPLDEEGIKLYVDTCIASAEKTVKEIADNAGSFSKLPSGGIIYDYVYHRYLCRMGTGNSCMSTIPTRFEIEQELNARIEEKISNCLDWNALKAQGFKVKESPVKVLSKIGTDDVIISVKIPVILSKGDAVIALTGATKIFPVPLGKMLDLAIQITNEEILNGFFDEDKWMTGHGAEILIHKHKPYPNTVYLLSKRVGKDYYTFPFAIQGLDTVQYIGTGYAAPSLDYYCNIPSENNCYANVNPELCEEKRGEYTAYPSNCGGLSNYSTELCDGSACKDCSNGKNHGDSWCVYDSIVGQGRDWVGSRHYKVSCIDGNIIPTECGDYRTEFCGSTNDKAMCTKNRWQDCSMQSNEADCKNSNTRDCSWILYYERMGSGNGPEETGHCVPSTAPGFKVWAGAQYDMVCDSANDGGRCPQEALSCPDVWAISTIRDCTRQGDCGNGYNVAGELTEKGYTNSEWLTQQQGGGQSVPQIHYGPQNPDWRNYGIALSNRTADLLSRQFSYHAQTDKEMIEGFNGWLSWASSWKGCKSKAFCPYGKDEAFDCKCFKGPKKPLNENFNYYVWGVSFCNVWGVPPSGNCSQCFDSAYPWKPCTEYKCKSLGSNCQFSWNYATGHPECSSHIDQSFNSPLVVALDYDSVPDDWEINDIDFPFGASTLYGYVIDHPVMNLDDSLSFDLITNRNAQCKAFYVPGGSFYDITSSMFEAREIEVDGYQTVHAVNISAINPSAFASGILAAQNITDLVSTIQNVPVLGEGLPSFLESIGLADMEDTFQQLIFATTSNSYYVFFRCVDEIGQEDNQNTFVLFYVDPETDIVPPIIRVDAPGVNDSRQSGSINFSVYGEDNIATVLACNLWSGLYDPVSGSLTDYSIIDSTIIPTNKMFYWEVEFPPGEYQWHIACTDSVNQKWIEKRNLSVT